MIRLVRPKLPRTLDPFEIACQSLIDHRIKLMRSFNRFVGIALAELQAGEAQPAPHAHDSAQKLPFVLCPSEKQTIFLEGERRLIFREAVSRQDRSFQINPVDNVSVQSMADGGERIFAVEYKAPRAVYTFKFKPNGGSVYYQQDARHSELVDVKLDRSGKVRADGPCWPNYGIECCIGNEPVAYVGGRTEEDPRRPSDVVECLSASLPLTDEMMKQLRGAMEHCRKVLSEWGNDHETWLVESAEESRSRGAQMHFSGLCFRSSLRPVRDNEKTEAKSG